MKIVKTEVEKRKGVMWTIERN